MNKKWGMDIDEYSVRCGQISLGLNKLCDDMYAATEDDLPIDTVKVLLAEGALKIQLFEKLAADTHGPMHDELRADYGSYIEEIQGYAALLKQKYLS